MFFFPDFFRLFIHIRSFKILIFRKIQAFSGWATVVFLTVIHRHYASSQFPIPADSLFSWVSDILFL